MYVDQNSCLVAMLASKMSAGVAPEVNLRKATMQTSKESIMASKPRADDTRSPKQGHQWPHEKN